MAYNGRKWPTNRCGAGHFRRDRELLRERDVLQDDDIAAADEAQVRAILLAASLAVVFSVVSYYGRFGEAYSTLERVRVVFYRHGPGEAKKR